MSKGVIKKVAGPLVIAEGMRDANVLHEIPVDFIDRELPRAFEKFVPVSESYLGANQFDVKISLTAGEHLWNFEMIFCSIGQYYPRAIVYKSYGSIGRFQNC